MDNKYSLLNYDMDKPDKPTHKRDRCTMSIDKILWNAKDELVSLKRRYPDAGIGDTDTDECIIEAFYQIIDGSADRPKHCKL